VWQVLSNPPTKCPSVPASLCPPYSHWARLCAGCFRRALPSRNFQLDLGPIQVYIFTLGYFTCLAAICLKSHGDDACCHKPTPLDSYFQQSWNRHVIHRDKSRGQETWPLGFRMLMARTHRQTRYQHDQKSTSPPDKGHTYLGIGIDSAVWCGPCFFCSPGHS